MTIEKLEQLAERVKICFLTEIAELSNGEVEIVLEYLLQFFEQSIETVRGAVRSE
jgi:hypothetical protein